MIMKITFILPHAGLAGGIRVVAIYAERLQKRGHEILVVSRPKRQPTLSQQIRSFLKGQGFISPPKPSPSHLDQVDVPHRIIEQDITDANLPDADVVVATMWNTAESVAKLSPRKGAKAYFIQHHEIFNPYWPTEQVEATYSLPLHKIAIAQWLVDVMRTRYNDDQVSLVPNSVDMVQFNAPPRGKQPTPTVGLLYVKNASKGCDISLKAFTLAAQAIPNLHLVAFGSINPVPDLPLPPGTEYTYQPPQHSIKEIYAKCDAWLFGSRTEGFGLPILEAMACRTPVIGTPTGAAPELLADGAGILVKPENPEDMAKAIQQISQMSDPQWQTLSDAAYTKVTSYTWDNATERFEAALYTAIERWQRGELSR